MESEQKSLMFSKQRFIKLEEEKMLNIPEIHSLGNQLKENPQLLTHWLEKQQNIDLVMAKIQNHYQNKFHVKSRALKHENKITDSTLMRTVRLKQQLKQFEENHNQQVQSYRARLSQDREGLQQSYSHRKRSGSVLKQIRSLSHINMKIQEPVKNQDCPKIIEKLNYIVEKKKSLYDQSQRLSQLFKEDRENINCNPNIKINNLPKIGLFNNINDNAINQVKQRKSQFFMRQME